MRCLLGRLRCDLTRARAESEERAKHFRAAAEIYVGIENLFNTTYSVGRTGDGVVSIGAPLLVHGGIRISLR